MWFLVFGCIWNHFVTGQNSVQNEPNRCNYCKSSCNEVASEFFTTNAPDLHNWTINSCFGAFRSVWVHLGPFHCCTKLSAKRAEQVQLMQKSVQRSCVGILRNECIPSTPLDPKLMFWCVSYCMLAFGTLMLLHGTRCKTGKTDAINPKVSATKLCRNFSQWRHPIHTIGS